MSPAALFDTVNLLLSKHDDSKHIRVISVSLSKAGNFVIITRDDNASDLLPHVHKFAKALTRGQGYKAIADVPWYRVKLIADNPRRRTMAYISRRVELTTTLRYDTQAILTFSSRGPPGVTPVYRSCECLQWGVPGRVWTVDNGPVL